jgi:hypothetical protein
MTWESNTRSSIFIDGGGKPSRRRGPGDQIGLKDLQKI